MLVFYFCHLKSRLFDLIIASGLLITELVVYVVVLKFPCFA